MLSNGNLEFLGRIDHQVKIRGFRIELGEIENVLIRHSKVKKSVVLVKESPSGDKTLLAYVVTDAIELPNEQKNSGIEVIAQDHSFIDSIRQHLSESLPDYMIPSVFVFLRKMPLTVNGKIDLKLLPKPDGSDPIATYVPPRNKTERVLCDIWQDVLNVERVGINDDFLEIGGHSLLATRIVTRINLEFNANLSLQFMLSDATVSSIATQIETVELNNSNLDFLNSKNVEEGTF